MHVCFQQYMKTNALTDYFNFYDKNHKLSVKILFFFLIYMQTNIYYILVSYDIILSWNGSNKLFYLPAVLRTIYYVLHNLSD